MRHSKRRQSGDAAYPRTARQAGRVLDDRSVEQVLAWPSEGDDGDPISGIRNALIASAVFWLALALLVAALLR